MNANSKIASMLYLSATSSFSGNTRTWNFASKTQVDRKYAISRYMYHTARRGHGSNGVQFGYFVDMYEGYTCKSTGPALATFEQAMAYMAGLEEAELVDDYRCFGKAMAELEDWLIANRTRPEVERVAYRSAYAIMIEARRNALATLTEVNAL